MDARTICNSSNWLFRWLEEKQGDPQLGALKQIPCQRKQNKLLFKFLARQLALKIHHMMEEVIQTDQSRLSLISDKELIKKFCSSGAKFPLLFEIK